MEYKITKIEIFKKNSDFVNIYVNEEYAFTCSKEVIFTHCLKVNKVVQMKELEDIIEADNYLRCKNASLKIIERSYKTVNEIEEKLRDKGYNENSIKNTIEFLKEYKFLDDEKYTQHYINSKLTTEGRNKMKFKLIKRGINEETIEEKLKEIDSKQEEEVALKLAEKKYKTIASREKDKRKIYRKVGDYLIRKGYSYDIVKKVLRKTLNEDIEEEY